MDDKMVIFRKGSRIYGDGVIDIWSLREGTTEPIKIDRIRYSLMKSSIPGQTNNSLKDR